MPSCPTFMGFAVGARDSPACGGRGATALSVLHMLCDHRPLHVDFKTLLHSGIVRDSFAGLRIQLNTAVACSPFAANPKRSRRALRCTEASS